MDLRKLKDKASEALAKGKFGKAAELFEDYCKADPKDFQARLRLGDARARQGEKEKAIHAYLQAAEGFANGGFVPRAIAAGKLVLELDPSHKTVQKMLADLYAQKPFGPAQGQGKAAPVPSAAAVAAVAAAVAASGPSPAVTRPAAIELPPDEGPAPVIVDASGMAIGGVSTAVAAVQQPGSGALEATGGEGIELDLSADLPPELALPVKESSSDERPPSSQAAATSKGSASIPPPPASAGEASLPPGAAAPPRSQPSVPRAASADPVLADRGSPGAGGASSRPTSGPAAPIAASNARSPDADAVIRSVGLPTPTSARPPPETGGSQPGAESGGASGLPPGLRPKKKLGGDAAPGEASAGRGPSAPPESMAGSSTAAPRETASRIWLPPGFGAASGQQPPGPAPSPQAVPAPRVSVPTTVPTAAKSFTELELDDESLLQAVERAAGPSSPPRRPGGGPDEVVEELVVTPDEVGAVFFDGSALPRIPLFSDLSPDAFIELFERCPLRRHGESERIIEQGTRGDAFYVICAGSVRVYREVDGVRQNLAVLQEGAFFGEMALLSDALRSASVESASEDTQLLEISAPLLAELSGRYPQVAKALKKFCRQRMLSNVMTTSPLFRQFGSGDRRELVTRFRARDVNKGEVLLREGTRSDGMYVVLSGEVDVTRGGDFLASLREGEVFGEISLLRKTPATATVTATRRTALLRLPREDFDHLILSHPQILALVSEMTDERQAQNEGRSSLEDQILF